MVAFFCTQPTPLRVYVRDMAKETMRRTPCEQLFRMYLQLAYRAGQEYPYAVKFAAELLIPTQLVRSPYATADPEAANLILVAECTIGRGQQGQHIPAVAAALRAAAPATGAGAGHLGRWQAHGGHDHVIVLTGDHGPCLLFKERSGINDPQRYRIKRWHDKSISNMTMVMNEGSLLGGCYVAGKDLSVPSSEGYSPSMFHDPGCERPIATRSHLAFFSGKYNSHMRKNLKRFYGDDPQVYIPERLSKRTYLCAMADSTFCICPRGEAAWSPRLEEAVRAGCIPVILADDYDPPFSRILNYSRFSLRIPQDKVETLKQVLLDIPAARVAELHRGILHVRAVFTYGNHSLEAPYRGDDMTPLLAYALWTIRQGKVQRGLLPPAPGP